MARTNVLVSVMFVLCPIAALAGSAGPAPAGDSLLAVGAVVTDCKGPVSPGNDLLTLDVVPSDESWLMLPASNQANTIDCRRTSSDFECPASCASRVDGGIVDLQFGAPVEPTTADLRLFLLAAVILGGLWHFLTSPDYAALWDRLFSPLNWD